MSIHSTIALVTGAAGSIGSAICQKLSDNGATIIVCDMDLSKAQRVAAEINQNGGTALPLSLDVSKSEEVEKQVGRILKEYSGIDILVNCAGGSAREKSALFHKSKEDVWDWVLNVNLKGVRNLTRAVIEHMISKNRGRIINITSIIGVQGKAGYADYAAAKGGVIAFTKSLAMEVGSYGITVNCVSPGLVPREAVDADFAKRNSYVGVVCTPANIAGLVSFLTSDEAGYITGQNYIVDGGRSLGLKGD